MPAGAEGPKPELKPVSRTAGEANPPERKEFSVLTAPEKVKAILAGAGEPVSQEMVYDFAGIKPDTLTDQEKEAVHAIFHDSRIQHAWDEKYHVEQYRIDPAREKEIFQEIGVELDTVKRHIVDYFTTIHFFSAKW